MKPKISIIVPVYNVEKYIRKCIDSVLKQTFTNFELILVDDGSPDNCGAICDEYAKRDHRIQVIHKVNGGLSSARNAALEVAQDDYIAFVDSDDFINWNMFELLYDQVDKNAADIIICDYIYINESVALSTFPESICTEYEPTHFNNIQALQEIYNLTNHPGRLTNPTWIIMCNKLYKRDLFQNNRFKEGIMYEDEMIAHKLLFDAKKIAYIPVGLYYYLQIEGSLVRTPYSIRKMDKTYAYKQRADFFKEKGLHELHYKALKYFLDEFFWNYLLAKSTLPNIKRELRGFKGLLRKSLSKKTL